MRQGSVFIKSNKVRGNKRTILGMSTIQVLCNKAMSIEYMVAEGFR